MKTPHIPLVIKGLVATLGLVAATATLAAPLGQVSVSLFGEVLTSGQDIEVDSGTRRIEAAQRYTYQLKGTCQGTGLLAGPFPAGTSIAEFLETIKPGASKILKGKVRNDDGNLDTEVILFEKKFSGAGVFPGIGSVDMGVTLNGTIQPDGQCVVSVSGVKFESIPPLDLGTVKFLPGSKLVISAAPEITFPNPLVEVRESVASQSVVVSVKRAINQKGNVSVDYTTVPGTATPPDYTHTSGTLEFPAGESSMDITVPIINNGNVDTERQFTIVLSNPANGAVLGDIPSITVTINDDD
jgi:hypothetical protein